MPSDIIAAVEPVVAAFEVLGVSYRIGGSVASSALGVPRSTLDVEAFSRRVRGTLDTTGTGREFDLTTAEDIVLHKLAWYRLGGGVADRQWRDAVGVIAVQAQSLDRTYLTRWATSLGLADLLERAFAEAGVP